MSTTTQTINHIQDATQQQTTLQDKRKIAVLGGGMGAMTAVLEIISSPNWADKYDITVYQMGWRLGGKGASGRDMANHNRIYEHGLHVWGGFYDNAFRVIQQAYKMLNRPAGSPIATWEEAFTGQEYFFLQEVNKDGTWTPWTFHLPKRNSEPGDPDNTDAPSTRKTFWDYVVLILRWIKNLRKSNAVSSTTPTKKQASLKANFPQWQSQFHELDHQTEQTYHAQSVNDEVDELVHYVETMEKSAEPKRTGYLGFLTDMFDHLRAKLIVELNKVKRGLRHLYILADLGLTLLRGIVADGLLSKPFDSINHMDFAEWLKHHGASKITYESVLIQALYDIIFAYPDGVSTLENRNIEAGTMLRACLRVARYRGHAIYRMNGGMGDIIFTPMYEVMRREGVKFEFFSKVESLHLSDDKQRIDKIRIGQQATLKGDDYEPLIDVDGLGCWPAEPLYDQLLEGRTLQTLQINLESNRDGWANVREFDLIAGHDFDDVILGISIGGLRPICEELIANSPKWEAMFDAIKVNRTQGVQYWFNVSLNELGWDRPEPMTGTIPNTQASTWVSMNQLLPYETWQFDEVKNIAYFTGVLNDSSDDDHALQAVKDGAEKLLSNISQIWPNAGQPDNPNQLNWDLLVAPKYIYGKERFYHQYFRANFEGTELYVLSVVNSTAKRIKSGETGFSNLYLAGDWTLNNLNLGMIESAVMSGMQASQAICGYPKYIAAQGDFY